MQCDSARNLLGAFSDRELQPSEHAAVAAHLESCRACRELLADYRRLGRALSLEGRPPLPPALEGRIVTALDGVDAAAPSAGTGRSRAAPSNPRTLGLNSSPWLARAASILLCCLLSASGAWWLASRAGDADRVQRELLNAHVRSLLQDSPIQVASSDQHTVRPWFAGRTDIAPNARDLASEGFALAGGRLDYVDGHRASVLVYKRRQHLINVFMWHAAGDTGDTAPVASTRNGYHMISYRRGGITTWLVSDLNADELRQLEGKL